MKRMILAFIAAVAIGTTAVAQQPRQGMPNKEEMAKHRTERMVKQYGLTDDQSVKLLALNTKYADQMRPRGGHRGPRHEGGNPNEGQQRPPMMTDEQRQEFQKTMEAYNKELEDILTAEQYAKYKEDMDKRRQGGPRGPRGPRM